MQFIYYNIVTGKISLLLDGVLRPFPSMDTFLSLYSGDIKNLGRIDYTDVNTITYAWGPALSTKTMLCKAPDSPAIYLYDDMGTGSMHYRPFINWQTLASYGFNLQLIQLVSSPANTEIGEIVSICTKTLYHTQLGASTITQYIESINSSGFTTVNIMGLGVTSDGDSTHLGQLTIGNQVLVSQNGVFNPDKDPNIASYNENLNAIKLNGVGGSVNRLMFTIGGWDASFYCIYDVLNPQPDGKGGYTFSNVDLLTHNFKTLKASLPSINGIDLDNEDSPAGEFPASGNRPYPVQAFVKFIQIISDAGFSVTFCPYTNQEFWLNCLNQVTVNNQYPVTEYNLQCYGGGVNNKPSGWVKPQTPNGFIVPGFDPNSPSSPENITATMNGWKNENYTPRGGFIWGESIINDSAKMKKYANALVYPKF